MVFLLPRNRLFGVSVPKGACNVVQTDNRDANSFLLNFDNDPIMAGLLSGRGWGDVIQSAEDDADRRFIHMSAFDFNREKTVAKEMRRFGSWNAWLKWVHRIEAKRAALRALRPPPPLTHLDHLMGLRRDYVSEPHKYFKTPVDRDAELYKLEGEIRKQHGGRDTLEKILAFEQIEVLPQIHSVISRVKEQLQAANRCKKIIAGSRISHFLAQQWRIYTWRPTALSRIPDEAWEGYDHSEWYGAPPANRWEDEDYVPPPPPAPPAVPRVRCWHSTTPCWRCMASRADVKKVLGFTGCDNFDHMDRTQFELFLKLANDDVKNGTIRGISPAIHAKCSKPMDLSVLSRRTLKVVSGYLDRAVKVLEQPRSGSSFHYAGYGAFGDVHEEGEHVDDDEDSSDAE